MPGNPNTWRAYVAEQDQVIARWQALAGGLSADAWDWRLGHTWQSLLPGVAVAHTGGVTERQRAWAAVLRAGHGAALSGDAALLQLGFQASGARQLWGSPALDVAVPSSRKVAGRQLPDRRRIVCHKVARLQLWVTPIRGLAVVNAHAAALHACAWAPTDKAAEWRIAAVVQQGVSAVPLLRGTLAEMPRLPRRQLIRLVLDDVELGAHAASELQFLQFCRAYGLPLPDEMQLRVRADGKTRYVDGHYRAQQISFELDGAHHRMAGQWEADQLRALELAVARRGSATQVIRLSPGALRHDGPRIAALLRVLLCP
jgi:hypothetical protein